MRRGACCLLILSLASCDALGIQPAKQAVLVGEWDWSDEHSKYPQHCGSLLTLRYFPNGQYYLLGVIGTWRLEGNTLTEKSEHYVHDDEGPEDIGQTFSSTLKWIDENTFLRRDVSGNFVEFRRCPEAR